jgi:hypothetical protein
MIAALKQLDAALIDLPSAADAGNQKEAESALKEDRLRSKKCNR